MSPDGGPGALTASRAGWLAFHLCRTGVAGDAERLLQERWASAYLAATGTRATYLAALREVIDRWALAVDWRPSESSEDDLSRCILLGGLAHAHYAALVAEVPADALVAKALLGHANAALHQAIEDPLQWRAARTMVDIVEALARRQALTPRLIELAGDLIDRLRNNVAQCGALSGLSSVLAASHPEGSPPIGPSPGRWSTFSSREIAPLYWRTTGRCGTDPRSRPGRPTARTGG